VSEHEVDGQDALDLEEKEETGRINADLTIGTDVTKLVPLKANEGLSCNGMMLAGKGFKIDRKTAERFIAADGAHTTEVIRPYIGGGCSQES
jgi:hypothetical protein